MRRVTYLLDFMGLRGTFKDSAGFQDSVESAISPLIEPELRVRVELDLIEFEQFGFGTCLTSNNPASDEMIPKTLSGCCSTLLMLVFPSVQL